MKNRYDRVAIAVAILFEIILVVGVIFKILSNQWNDLYQYLVAITCIIIPFIITKIVNHKKIVLPSTFQLASVSFILLALYFGEIMQLYTKFWWWDLFLHGTFGCYAVIIGIHIMKGIVIKPSDVTIKRYAIFTLIISFCFTITLGTIWEMIEFLADYFFHANMVNGGLEDTASDLLIKMFGALSTSLIYYFVKLRKKVED